jgi:hypothetical protein
MTKTMIALLAASALSLGCDKGEGGDGKTGSSADSIGVAECDDYLKKWEACFSKQGAAAKAAAEPGMKQMRDAWKAAAAQGGAAKDALKTGCKSALDTLAQNPACK